MSLSSRLPFTLATLRHATSNINSASARGSPSAQGSSVRRPLLVRAVSIRAKVPPAWSGKEHTDSMEQKPMAGPEDADPLCQEGNPTGKAHPTSFHPSGSTSEQIVAGERDAEDPLKELKASRQKAKDKAKENKDESLRDIEDDQSAHYVGP